MAYKVLLIEDNTDCRELFAVMIRHLGFQVLQADDGEIGVQKALRERPDLILMDLNMPSMGGIEATTCLQESSVTRNTPIIICTAWMAEQHCEGALRCGRPCSHLQTRFCQSTPDRVTALPAYPRR